MDLSGWLDHKNSGFLAPAAAAASAACLPGGRPWGGVLLGYSSGRSFELTAFGYSPRGSPWRPPPETLLGNPPGEPRVRIPSPRDMPRSIHRIILPITLPTIPPILHLLQQQQEQQQHQDRSCLNKMLSTATDLSNNGLKEAELRAFLVRVVPYGGPLVISCPFSPRARDIG